MKFPEGEFLVKLKPHPLLIARVRNRISAKASSEEELKCADYLFQYNVASPILPPLSDEDKWCIVNTNPNKECIGWNAFCFEPVPEAMEIYRKVEFSEDLNYSKINDAFKKSVYAKPKEKTTFPWYSKNKAVPVIEIGKEGKGIGIKQPEYMFSSIKDFDFYVHEDDVFSFYKAVKVTESKIEPEECIYIEEVIKEGVISEKVKVCPGDWVKFDDGKAVYNVLKKYGINCFAPLTEIPVVKVLKIGQTKPDDYYYIRFMVPEASESCDKVFAEDSGVIIQDNKPPGKNHTIKKLYEYGTESQFKENISVGAVAKLHYEISQGEMKNEIFGIDTTLGVPFRFKKQPNKYEFWGDISEKIVEYVQLPDDLHIYTTKKGERSFEKFEKDQLHEGDWVVLTEEGVKKLLKHKNKLMKDCFDQVSHTPVLQVVGEGNTFLHADNGHSNKMCDDIQWMFNQNAIKGKPVAKYKLKDRGNLKEIEKDEGIDIDDVLLTMKDMPDQVFVHYNDTISMIALANVGGKIPDYLKHVGYSVAGKLVSDEGKEVITKFWKIEGTEQEIIKENELTLLLPKGDVNLLATDEAWKQMGAYTGLGALFG